MVSVDCEFIIYPLEDTNVNTFIVTTQALENYAMPDINPLSDMQYYFKYKFGSDYRVTGFLRAQDALAYVALNHCHLNNDYVTFPTKVLTEAEYRKELEEEFGFTDTDTLNTLFNQLEEVGI